MTENYSATNEKLYPTYKPSGATWIWEIPEHWRMTAVKREYEIQMGKMLQPQPKAKRDVEVSYLKALNVQWYSVDTKNAQTMWANHEEIHQLELLPGDLLVCEGGEGGRAGIVDNIPKGFIIQNALHRVRPRKASMNEFLQHMLKVISESGLFEAINNKATIAHFTKEKFEALQIPIPTPQEQAAIVRYLDHVDQRIQAYISAKGKLIALLEEQRQAVIHQAVTRGLDPNVKLKPSSVEWLGEVPEHWEIQRSKQIFRPRGELAKPDDIQLSATQAYGVIPQDEFEESIGRRVVKISLNLEKRQHVEVDDFVISMRSFQGGLERAWATGCIRSSYVVLSPVREVETQFFSFLFKSQAYIRALQLTANFIRDGQDLNFNNFSAVDLPVPPIEEQKQTGKYLGESTTRIETTISRTRRQIVLMEEYRTRLIADVVTGKLDVRKAAEELPQLEPTEITN